MVLKTFLTIWLVFDWWDWNHKVYSLDFIKISSIRVQIEIWSSPCLNAFPDKSWKSNTGEYSLINDLSLCRRKTSLEGSGVVDLLDHLTCLWLMRSESQGIFTWLHQDELNKRGQIKIWSTPHPNVCFKKLKKLNTRAYPLIVDMVYCRRKMCLMASGHVFVDILDLFRLCEHWKGKQKPLWDAQLWD